MTDTKIVIPPDFKGRELIIGTPGEFENVRQSQRNENKRTRTFTSITDLAAYVQTWGTREKTTVFADVDAVVALLDETDAVHTLRFQVAKSTAWEEWDAFIGKKNSQATFAEFLERRCNDAENGVDLWSKVANLEVVQTREIGGQYTDSNNYQVAFSNKTTGRDDVLKLPKKFLVTIPLFDGDPATANLTIDLKLIVPKTQGDPLAFELRCHDLDDVFRQAIRDKITQLRGLLEGWQVYEGAAK